MGRNARKAKGVQKRELNYLWEVIEIEEIKQDPGGILLVLSVC